jgi:hypothetical protein
LGRAFRKSRQKGAAGAADAVLMQIEWSEGEVLKEAGARYRLPPANRSRRVCLCVAQTQNTPHSRIPLNAATKSGDQDVEVTEKKQFPVSGFSGGFFRCVHTSGRAKKECGVRRLRTRFIDLR